MSKSFSFLFYHWVFATKLRRPLIRDPTADELHAYMGGILRSLGGQLIEAGGVEDHRHLVTLLPPAVTVADAINKVKSGSTGWQRRTKGRRLFGWQNGYAAFSVSPSQIPGLIRYVRTQQRRHARMSFRQELIRLFERHGLEPDPREIEKFCRHE